MRSVGSSDALSPSHPAPRSPRGTTIAPPAAHVKRAWPGSDAELLRQPGVAGRRAWPEAEHRRQTDAGERPVRGWGDGEAGPVTRTRAAATVTAPPKTTRGRGPAARARSAAARPPCTPPPAAGRRSVDTPRRRGRTPGAAAPPTATHAPAAPSRILLRLGAHRNDPDRHAVCPEHAVKEQRVKAQGRNQQRQLLDELQRVQ